MPTERVFYRIVLGSEPALLPVHTFLPKGPEPMTAEVVHPSQRFVAPSSIERQRALKDLMGETLVTLIGESLAEVVPGFDRIRFQARATDGLATRELKPRALHIAEAMAEQLPTSFAEAGPLLIRSFGPPLTRTEGNGLAPFYYYPHAHVIAVYGVASLEAGLAANYELTQRFTAEWSVRPFLMMYRDKCLARLADWTSDANPHVRRLVSEGTRPRLPWATRLPEFLADPGLALPLLERLKDDPELYVRRSVANHLGDIAKDHLDVVLGVCQTWLDEAEALGTPSEAECRRWIVRHALRYPAKRGEPRALVLRARASKSSC